MGVTEHGLKVGARAGLCSVVAALLLGVFAVASVAVVVASATGSKVSAFTTRVEVSGALLIGGDHQPALAPSVLASSGPILEYDAPVGSLVDASTPVLSEGAFPQVIVDTGGSPGVGAESVGTRTTSALSLVTPRATSDVLLNSSKQLQSKFKHGDCRAGGGQWLVRQRLLSGGS